MIKTKLQLIRGYFRIKRQSDVPRSWRDDQGRVCALGALRDFNQLIGENWPKPIRPRAEEQLEAAAVRIFGMPAAGVNDSKGRSGVLRIYRRAILGI